MSTRKSTTEKIESVRTQKQQLENQIKRLLQQQRKEERKERDRRYYERGKHVESLVSGADSMTNEQFYKIIEKALNKQFPTKTAHAVPAGQGTDEGTSNSANPLQE
jgi:flagellar biosynthesis/type III secretory pathway chaperone